MISFAVSLLPLVEDDAVMGLVEGGKHHDPKENIFPPSHSLIYYRSAKE